MIHLSSVKLALISVFSSAVFLACASDRTRAVEPNKVQTEESDDPPEREAMDPAKLSYALRGSEDDFRKCFMRAMDSRGAVATRFSVDASGTVTNARVTTTDITNAGVNQCLIDELRSQKFGTQPTLTDNSYTFVFRLTEPLSEHERKHRLKKADREHEALKLLPESKGTIDLGHVADIVQARYPLYAHCYRDSIRRRGESRGLVRFRLHIDATGHVSEVEDEGSVLPDPFAVDCMAEAFCLMSFNAPDGPGAVVRYSMELQ